MNYDSESSASSSSSLQGSSHRNNSHAHHHYDNHRTDSSSEENNDRRSDRYSDDDDDDEMSSQTSMNHYNGPSAQHQHQRSTPIQHHRQENNSDADNSDNDESSVGGTENNFFTNSSSSYMQRVRGSSFVGGYNNSNRDSPYSNANDASVSGIQNDSPPQNRYENDDSEGEESTSEDDLSRITGDGFGSSSRVANTSSETGMNGHTNGEDVEGDDAVDDDDNSLDDDDMSSPPPPQVIAPPPRGKVLRRTGESSDDSNSDHSKHQIVRPTISSTPKVAATADVEDSNAPSSSSDDELLVNRMTKKKKKTTSSKKNKKKSSSTVASGSSKKKPLSSAGGSIFSKKKKKKPSLDSKKSSITKKKQKKTPSSSAKKKTKKSKNIVAATVEEDEDENVMAAVVIEDEDEMNSDSDVSEVVAVAVAEVVKKKKQKKSSGAKSETKKNAGTSSSAHKKKLSSKTSKGSGSSKVKKKRKRNSSNDSSSEDSVAGALPANSVIPQDKMEAAEQARDILLHSIQRIPIEISESYTVRNFGRIKIEEGAGALDTLYSSPNVLHPVGFSCDRYEFSPVHGRVIKMRCDILDGSKIILSPEMEDETVIKENNDTKDNRKNINKDVNERYNGPIFRIMWGKGIDECGEVRSFPFDLYSASALVGGEVDAVAVPLGLDTVKIAPEPGMRVKVRFDNDLWYGGYVRKVVCNTDSDDPKKTKKKSSKSTTGTDKTAYNVQILYDDGAKEEATYPDPDIVLLPPGSEETGDGCILHLTEIKGKPVTTVTGKSPVEAWGKVLIKLGLIDEIMFQSSQEACAAAKLEGLAEVKGKIESIKKQRQEARARHLQRLKEKSKENDDDNKQNRPIIVRVKEGEAIEPDDSDGMDDDDRERSIGENEQEGSEDRESETEKEEQMRKKIKTLREAYEVRLAESRATAIALADARIASIGPFLGNPFHDVEGSVSLQKNWLATVVRKEKAKMGSTGNRRKIVTATDLLERNASFFNSDIERLVEGLPGSEFCPGYVFHDLRGTGASSVNQAWVHEVQLRQEKEQQKKKKRAHEDEAKASFQREKERKRKAREDDRENRKKQRLEELEEKKKAREEERLLRLSTQVDERLFKEACLQREKIVLFASKVIGREIARRRKAAEVMAAYAVELSAKSVEVPPENPLVNELFKTELPPLYKKYHCDVLRIWNFVSAYQDAFKELSNLPSIPSLDKLQDAISCIQNDQSKETAKKEAAQLLTNLAIMLCKPISAGLVKTLSSVLATMLQEKDINKDNVAEGDKLDLIEKDPDSYPVNTFTWREIARLALLSDALNELGYSKQEQAHLLRGFRSGGHPNSKEAKRLRRGEDYALVLRRQALSEMSLQISSSDSKRNGGTGLKVRVNVPCEPLVQPTDWVYFLHNIKSLPSNAATAIKSNVRKAYALLKTASPESLNGRKIESITSDLQRSLTILEQIGTAYKSSSETISACNRAKQNVLRILDKVTGEIFSSDVASEPVYRNINLKVIEEKDSSKKKKITNRFCRQRIGLVNSLFVSDENYKKFILEKEEYMASAIKLKEDQERKQKAALAKKNDDNDDEDDDDDDDDDDEDDEEDEDDDNDNDETKEDIEKKSDAAEDEKKSSSDIDKDNVYEDGISSTVKDATATGDAPLKIGKKTNHDFFCEDNPYAPELIRRCLAVLRILCCSASAEPFIYPVDPQTNPKYYELILRPMSLYDIGKTLQAAGQNLRSDEDGTNRDNEVEAIVAQFGRNVRLIAHNCSVFSNVGGAIISSAEEMIRIFERLFFDWVLAPAHLLPTMEMLDDDRCVEYHPSDEDSMVLLCDGCEGKFNMSRLDPPLISVPKGDWYCPRCLNGRSWPTLDPRIGRNVVKTLCQELGDAKTMTGTTKEDKIYGKIKRCMFSCQEGSNARSSLIYIVEYDGGDHDTWTLEMVDNALEEAGDPVPSIRCLEAVAESPGYGSGTENGLVPEILPVSLNPLISDNATQKAVSSTIFQDTIVTAATLLLNDAQEMTAPEWLRLLVLLVMKCSTSDQLQEVVNKLENEAFLKVTSSVSETAKIKSIEDVLPKVTDDEDDEIDHNYSARDTTSGKLNLQKESKEGSEEEEWNETDTLLNKTDDKCTKKNVVPKAKVGKGKKKPIESVTSEETPETKREKENVEAGIDTSKVQGSNIVVTENVLSAQVEKKKVATALAAKNERQKAREDCLLAHYMKLQIKPTVASFEEDNATQAIDTSLASQTNGIDISQTRCHGILCDLCGLSDISLGAPLIRAPNHKEWTEMLPHSYGKQRFHLIAEVGSLNPLSYTSPNQPHSTKIAGDEVNETDVVNRESSAEEKHKDDIDGLQKYEREASQRNLNEMIVDKVPPDSVKSSSADKPISDFKRNLCSFSEKRVQNRQLLVKIRVGGELISVKEDNCEVSETWPNGGMLEFLPRNTEGFQHELRARWEGECTFISGSLSAHECCAIAAHQSRMSILLQRKREDIAGYAELDYGNSCGRSISLGSDKWGRSYWRFHSDPFSLFILSRERDSKDFDREFLRFSKPEAIASIMVCLGKDEPFNELKRAFPDAASLLKNRKWTHLLQKSSKSDTTNVDHEQVKNFDKIEPEKRKEKCEKGGMKDVDNGELDPYEEGEDVLVESLTGKLLWDARIVAVAKHRSSNKIKGYRVHYKEWSSRFDEWVDPIRVVEPSENNLLVQEELLEEMIAARDSIPPALQKLAAKEFVDKPHRARLDNSCPNFSQASAVGSDDVFEEVGTLKAAMLLVEAALPIGSVDTSEDGEWKPEIALCWRSMVTKANSPANLIGCLILLESAISNDWIRPNAEHLLSCLPRPWKAVNEASIASISLRLWILDRGIKYGLVHDDVSWNSSCKGGNRRSSK